VGCNVLRDPAEATPGRITLLLRDGGGFPRGRVEAVRVELESSYTSTIARLALSYSADAPPGMPHRLFLKLSRMDSQQRVVGKLERRREVLFHTRVAPMMPDPPVVRCYHAAFDEESGASHLLLDDVSITHVQATPRVPPPIRQAASAMEALADFHAFWWDNPQLGTIGTLPSPESAGEHTANARAHFPGFAAACAEAVSSERRKLYETVLDALPRLQRRVTGHGNLTVIHGDANFSNVLLPRDPESDRSRIIDWQLWGVSFAAEDLSHMIALFWDREHRRSMERELLSRYHDRLLRNGPSAWSWTDLWDDYRLAVILRVLLMPMWFWLAGSPAWRGSLERALQAFDDLGCRELLDA
jgi:hypothetical protein